MATAALSTALPFIPRFRFLGRADWVCPACGKLNNTRFVVGQAFVLCKAGDCHRRYGIGVTFYTPRHGGFNVRSMPHDYLIPGDTIPADALPAVERVAVEPAPGAPFHRVLITDDASDVTRVATVTP